MKKLKEGEALSSNVSLKDAAITCLKEALLKEEYEQCKNLVASARGLGANQGEIKDALASYKRVNTPGKEAGKGKNRLDFLKE